MVTTIQVSEKLKNSLERMKEDKESYEQVIFKMMNFLEQQKKEQVELMIEGCKEMAEESLKIAKEFEAIEDLRDWEW